jgi:hypothetical protein
MKYTQQVNLSAEYRPSEEAIIRDLARRMVTEIPLEALKRLMTYDKVDPDSKESQELLMNPNTPQWKVEQIHTLDIKHQIHYTTSIEITTEKEIYDLQRMMSPVIEYNEEYIESMQKLFNKEL